MPNTLPKRPGLLVSVRSATEAKIALSAGVDLIDVKEPSRGSLGRADDATLRAILSEVAGRRPVSAAMGELADNPDYTGGLHCDYLKWGLARAPSNWRQRLNLLGYWLTDYSIRGVVVAYADWQQAESPDPWEVAQFAVERKWSVLL